MITWFKKLFQGNTSAPSTAQEWVDYKGYRIAPTPRPENGQYRVAGIIEMVAEPVQQHQFVRADLIPSLTEAEQISLLKAKTMIDQLGPRLFSDSI